MFLGNLGSKMTISENMELAILIYCCMSYSNGFVTRYLRKTKEIILEPETLDCGWGVLIFDLHTWLTLFITEDV